MFLSYMYDYLFNDTEGISLSDVSGQLVEIADALHIQGEMTDTGYQSLLMFVDAVNAETDDDTERVVLYKESFAVNNYSLSDAKHAKIIDFLNAAVESSESAKDYASRNADGIVTFISETASDIGDAAGNVADEVTKPGNYILPITLFGGLLLYKALK